MSLTLNQLATSMPAFLAAGVSIELKGKPGIGKSEFVDQVRKAQGPDFGFSSLFLATQQPPDLLGLQFKGSMDYKGKTITISDPSLPLWMQTDDGKPVWHYERGILLLDEYGQAEGDVKRASAELLLNKSIGKWRLPPGWTVIACSNRAEDKSGVTKSFAFTINRRLEFDIRPDLASWEDWADRNGVSPLFVTFANQNPNIVFDSPIPDIVAPYCTPRSLMLLARVYKAMGGPRGLPVFETPEGKSNPVAYEAATGLIGEAAAAQLIGMLRLGQEMPRFKDIIDNPTGVKVPTRPDALMLMCYSLAARAEEDNIDPIMKYIERLPKEFTVAFGKSACRRNPDLVNSDAFDRWTDKNQALMMAIADRRK